MLHSCQLNCQRHCRLHLQVTQPLDYRLPSHSLNTVQASLQISGPNVHGNVL
jgi:hypothetical protein